MIDKIFFIIIFLLLIATGIIIWQIYLDIIENQKIYKKLSNKYKNKK